MKLLRELYYKKYSKKSYAISNVDLVIDRLLKNKKKGFYIDIGCNHPIKYNNTFLLYKRGWNGINIDLDRKSIKQFNIFRPNDINLEIALSDKEKKKDVYFYHERSAINTLSKSLMQKRKKKPRIIYKIKTQTLNNVLNKISINNNKINLMSIDVENHEFQVLKSFNFQKYKIDVVVIEFTDLSKKLETYNLSVEKIIRSKIYKLLCKNNYRLINWVNSDLIFLHKKSNLR
tara:strand:+ start:948 stop:1640 length:693 start_codon:yes stop_codon:yes gene_type:complete